MNCARFEERVLQLLDRREDLSAAVDLIPHANRCPRCARTREIGMLMGGLAGNLVHPSSDFEVLDRTVRGCITPTVVPAGFADRVLAAWRDERSGVSAGVSGESLPLVERLGGAGSLGDAGPLGGAGLLDNEGGLATVGEGAAPVGAERQQRAASWLKPVAWLTTLAATVLLLVSLEGGSDKVAPVKLDPAVASRGAPVKGSPFVMVEVERWTPVLNTLGDESLAVVRPLTRSLHLAYDLLKQHLLGGDGLEKIDARRFETDVFWS